MPHPHVGEGDEIRRPELAGQGDLVRETALMYVGTHGLSSVSGGSRAVGIRVEVGHPADLDDVETE